MKSDNDLICVSLVAGERKKYKSHKDAAGQNDLMQDSPRGLTLERSLAVLVRHEP